MATLYSVFIHLFKFSMDVASFTYLGCLFQCVGADIKKLVLHWDVLLFGIYKYFVLCALVHASVICDSLWISSLKAVGARLFNLFECNTA